MRRLLVLNILAVITLVLFSCSDDEGDKKYPDLHTELVEAYTDAAKKVSSIRLDNGTTYGLSRSISTTTADTTLRCVCSYVVDEDNSHVTPYTIGVVTSNYPIPASRLEGQTSAAFKVISSWVTDRYINAMISYKTTGKGSHQFGFVEDSLTTHADGTKTAYVSLFHLQPANDMESYTQKIYVSLPTWLYKEKADTVRLTLEDKEIVSTPL